MSSSISTKKDKLKVAAISLTATSDVEKNWSQAVHFVEMAADQGADWIQLPEMWTFMGDYRHLASVAVFDGSERLEKIRELAKKKGVVLFAGSLVEKPDAYETSVEKVDKYYNTLFVIGRDGSIVGKYRKVHLFNLIGKDGKKSHCESDGYLAGSKKVVVEIDGFKVFLSICYDLRFSPFYSAAMNSFGPFDIVVAPSAFTFYTGEAHWELLLRARAIECQSFVFAANQVGHHGNGKQSFGHSMIVDPWGRVLASTGNLESIAYGIIDRQVIREVRGQLPVIENRRVDVYS